MKSNMPVKNGRNITMIISEKQIMQLIAVAKDYESTINTLIMNDMASGSPKKHAAHIRQLLIDITNQQSEELKVIE